jgi:signal transduction histidine kinase
MKLIDKTQRIYLSLIIILLLILSVIFLFTISWAIRKNIDQALHSQLDRLVGQYQQAGFIQQESTPHLTITRLPEINQPELAYSDTSLYNSVEHETFPYRQIKKQIVVAGNFYRLTLRRSLMESDDLFYTILITELIFIVLLAAGLFVLNRKVLRRMWDPFYKTLHELSHYQIGGSKLVKWSETNIDEFQQLNMAFSKMITHIEKEYKSLKQFTENASHEIQTPLSIISNRIEMMLQEADFTKDQWKSLSEIYRAAGRLSRLNRALLLLTKIENQQFTENKQVDVSILLDRLIHEYKELIHQKDLVLTKNVKDKISITTNPVLMELLLRNMLSNAVKHNTHDGILKICLSKNQLCVANTGQAPTEEVSHYFERFHKQKPDSSSLGLGLAIIKEICEVNDFEYDYLYKEGLHIMKIKL